MARESNGTNRFKRVASTDSVSCKLSELPRSLVSSNSVNTSRRAATILSKKLGASPPNVEFSHCDGAACSKPAAGLPRVIRNEARSLIRPPFAFTFRSNS